MPIVVGAKSVFKCLESQKSTRISYGNCNFSLQEGLKEAGFDIGDTNSCVTPVFLKGGLGEATNLTVDLRENHGIFFLL